MFLCLIYFGTNYHRTVTVLVIAKLHRRYCRLYDLFTVYILHIIIGWINIVLTRKNTRHRFKSLREAILIEKK